MRGWQQLYMQPTIAHLVSTLADPDMDATSEKVASVCASFAGMYGQPLARVARGREVGGHAFRVDNGVVTIFFSFESEPRVEVFKRGNVKKKSLRDLLESIDRKLFIASCE